MTDRTAESQAQKRQTDSRTEERRSGAKRKLIEFDTLEVPTLEVLHVKMKSFRLKKRYVVPPTEAESNKTRKYKLSCCRHGESHFLMDDEMIGQSYYNECNPTSADKRS